MAKMKPGADADMPAESDLLDEIFRRYSSERIIEIDENNGINAELLDEREFVSSGGE